MKLIKRNLLLIIIILVSMPFQLLASNVSFLKYAVISDFSEADIEKLKQEYITVLKRNKPGDVTKWKNTETQNGGDITVIKQYRHNDNNCKRLMFKNRSKNQSATSYFNFCLIDQQWRLVE